MSEIIMGPCPKYQSVERNASWTRVGIDTRLRVEDHNIEDYKAHLQDCEKNPTIGLLARRKYITRKPMNYPEAANRNIRYMLKQPEIDSLQKSMENNIKTLYPRTKHIREYIINNERVLLDRIIKIRKYTVFNKLAIALKKII